MCIAIRKHSIGCCYKVTNIPTLSVDCLKPHSVSLFNDIPCIKCTLF